MVLGINVMNKLNKLQAYIGFTMVIAFSEWLSRKRQKTTIPGHECGKYD